MNDIVSKGSQSLQKTQHVLAIYPEECSPSNSYVVRCVACAGDKLQCSPESGEGRRVVHRIECADVELKHRSNWFLEIRSAEYRAHLLQERNSLAV